jgi:hypothetical protein
VDHLHRGTVLVSATLGDFPGISPPRPRSPLSYHHLASNSISYTTLHFHFSLQQRLLRRPRPPRDAQRCSGDLLSLVEVQARVWPADPTSTRGSPGGGGPSDTRKVLIRSFFTCEAFRARIIPAAITSRHVRSLGPYCGTSNGRRTIPHLAQTRFTTAPEPVTHPTRLELDLAKSSRVSLRRAPAQALRKGARERPSATWGRGCHCAQGGARIGEGGAAEGRGGRA